MEFERVIKYLSDNLKVIVETDYGDSVDDVSQVLDIHVSLRIGDVIISHSKDSFII